MNESIHSKIVNLDEATRKVDQARGRGAAVVQCHGCFDIVHPGHLRYLQFARRQGDLLVVSLVGDRGSTDDGQHPYLSEEVRAENLAALMVVDLVVIAPGTSAEQVIHSLKPDVYVKGHEFENSADPAFLREKSAVESHGGRLIFSSGETVFTSSELVDRLISPELESHRLNGFCRRYELTADKLHETLRRFRDLHVLVVGDLVIDRYVLCDALGVASESPVMSLVQRDERSYVGGAAIVARHLAALGAHAFLISAGAGDEATQEVSDVLNRESVDAHLVDARPSLVEKTRFLADDAKVLKVDRAQRWPLDSVAERHVATLLEQQSRIADAVIFCDFGYGMVTGGLLGRVLPTLRHNVKTISADVSGGRANLLDFRNVDLLCPTEREARQMLNDFDSGLSTLAWKLLDKTQACHLIVTLEKRGLVVFERQSLNRAAPEWSGRLKSEQLGSFAERVVDRLGCGDALLAAATLGLASGAGLMPAAYLGNAAAAIAIADMGNNPIDFRRLDDWVSARRELALRPMTAQPVAT